MKILSPRLSNSRQTTTSLLLAPHTTIRTSLHANSSKGLRHLGQRVLGKASYSTTSQRSFANTALRQACSKQGTRGRTCSHHNSNSPGAKLLASRAGNCAAYTTEATIVAEEPAIHPVFQSQTGTWQYVVADPTTSTAVIIDPALDYDPATQTASTQSADLLLALVKNKGYKVAMILETHAHADHLTAASYLRKRLAQEPEQQGQAPPISIGKRIDQVQRLFGQRYGVAAEEYEHVFDKLFDDDETFSIGEMKAQAIHLPGHTPDHLGYKIGNNVFCGDSIFHADIGTARCDFPGGSAQDLYNSCQKLLALGDDVKIWTGHDYPPEGREAGPVPWMSVRQHRELNKHIKDGVTKEEFVALREERDANLGEPKLLHQSLQMNIRAGRLPKPTVFGQWVLHLPLKLKS
ncbi:hypothetical protein LTS15_000802 [Exophiala xenobiotica]|nr:hypothetical protein LTS15_000802 [Exophiala xenobiotica]